MTRIRMAALTCCSVLVFLGLTILGEGARRMFSDDALLAMIVVLFGLTIASLFTEGTISTGVREDRGNRWVLAVFSLVGLLAAYFPAYTDRIGFWTLDGEGIRWVGVALFAAGGALRIWPVFELGRRFSGLVAIQPGHTLVTTGLYAKIRNPSYLGLLVNSVGGALCFRSTVGLMLTAVLIPPLVARMNAEERLLREQFDGEYADYCRRTARLIPGIY